MKEYKEHIIRYKVNPKDIAYIKFTLEAYDLFGALTTIDRKMAIIQIRVSESYRELCLKVMEEIGKEKEGIEQLARLDTEY
ncbi:MAG: DUF4911 domain-containing protein [Pseudomonadota bacterium]